MTEKGKLQNPFKKGFKPNPEGVRKVREDMAAAKKRKPAFKWQRNLKNKIGQMFGDKPPGAPATAKAKKPARKPVKSYPLSYFRDQKNKRYVPGPEQPHGPKR